MTHQLQQYAADHCALLTAAAAAAGFADPVAIDLGTLQSPLLKRARKGALVPVEGVLVRGWNPDSRPEDTGVELGMRLYQVEGVRFVYVHFPYHQELQWNGVDFTVVDRRDYRQLYRIALRCRRDVEPTAPIPVLPGDQRKALEQNTLGYLEEANLKRIKSYGGRARRGVLLTGAPGTGKTMACRWLWEECRRRRWEWQLITPDAYRQARKRCNAVQAVRALFTVARRGIIFFDDMDLALRDRDKVSETDDQAVFLTAMDGITANEGVVFVFTTNCSLDLIDRAFKRPGRIDVVLHFTAPDAELRRQLLERWHAEIRAALDLEAAVASTNGYSFAEIEELKNLLVLHFLESGQWSWGSALKQFEANRNELSTGPRRHVGFVPVRSNGHGTRLRDDGSSCEKPPEATAEGGHC